MMRKKLRYWALIGLAFVFLPMACTQASTSTADPPRLEGSSLRNALRGATLEVIDPPHDAPTHYRFACDGKWIAIGGQAGPYEAPYSISNDRYCLDHFGGERSCHAVYRGRGSTLYLATIREDFEHIGLRQEFRRHGRMIPCGIGEG